MVFQDQFLFCQKLHDGKHFVWGCTDMVQDPLVGEQFWPHNGFTVSDVPELGDETFSWPSDYVGQSLGTFSLCSQRNKWTQSLLLILTSTLSWGRAPGDFHCTHCCFFHRVLLRNLTFIPSDESVQLFVILLDSLLQISTNFPPQLQLVITGVLGDYLCPSC
jgi:hypothetical protein